MIMTSLCGYIVARYDDLYDVLGPPMDETGDANKVQTEWDCYYVVDERPCFLYDWKIERLDESRGGWYAWHVGGNENDVADELQTELKKLGLMTYAFMDSTAAYRWAKELNDRNYSDSWADEYPICPSKDS
jgi:adenosylmethionine-8-amino-7-oxononanoate aminotransferase